MTQSETTTVDEEGVQDRPGDVNVELREFRKVFTESDGSDIVAVDDLNLEIRDGEFLVFVGPSGCGKTTTLRSIAGLETPSEGSIWIDGEDVTGLDPRQRGVAMVFQNYALYPHMTVRENMSFPLRIRNYPDDEIEDRVEYAADLLSIPDLLDRKPSALSGGQQQRVALGRAIVREPSVFLMDEPLSNLDAKLRVEMRTELNEIHQRVEKTTIYVTHNQAEAMTLGDRVAVMNDGELQQVGPPQRLYDNPKNRFVAGFIGEPPMSFFEVDVEERDGGYWATSTEGMFAIRLPDAMVASLDVEDALHGRYTLGIRPEDMHDPAFGDVEASDGNTIRASVKIVEPMGSDKFLTLIPEGGGPEFTARVSPESESSPGDTIELAVNAEKMHLFDPSTGENLSY